MIASSPRSRRSGPHLRTAAWLGMLVLLLSLLAPMATTQAPATNAAARQDCPPGFDWNQDTGECEQQGTAAPLIDPDFPPAQATLPPDVDLQITPTPTPTPQAPVLPIQVTVPPPAQATIPPDTVEPSPPPPTPEIGDPPEIRPVSLLVQKYECGPGVDRDANVGVLWEVCASPASIAVTLTHGTVGGSETSQTTAGFSEWEDLFAGHHYIYEGIPTGFGEPVVWCGVINAGERSAPLSRFTVEFGNTIGVELLAGQRMQCYWFNFLLATEGTSTVTLIKHDCETFPPGFRTVDEWVAACPDTSAGVGLTLSNIAWSRHLETDASGRAVWTGVPEEGLFRITEDVRPGYGDPVVWCQSESGEAGEDLLVTPPTYIPVFRGAIEGEITVPGTRYECHWFNIPDETPGEGSTIKVQKYICPERVEPDTDFETARTLCTEPGDGIDFTLDHAGGTSTKTITGGRAEWRNLPEGSFTIAETTDPARFPDPVWFCHGFVGADFEPIERVGAPLGVLEGSIEYPDTTYTCYVFNVPFFDRTVTVRKWNCPPGVDPLGPEPVACRSGGDGVSFTLTDASGSVTKTTMGGSTTWYGVERGDLTLDEEIPPGYREPIVQCALEASDEAGLRLSEEPTVVRSTDGAVTRNIPHIEFDWVCHFFNISEGDAEITINKWTCPPDYDVEAPGADPTVDCTAVTNGVVFTVEMTALTSVTGEGLPGVAHFGGLHPETYRIIESVPDGTESSFVWDCVGGDIPAVHPRPLSIGDSLIIEVAGGDSITCDWYNVPITEGGSLTVEKHMCWTETFVSEVDCEVYEHGATFELLRAFEDVSLGTGTTGAGGTYTWSGLSEGSYRLEETSHEPCHIASEGTDIEGNFFVSAGSDTVVKVYNCTPDEPGTPPGEPGKPPTDWPNTGADPGARPQRASQQVSSPEAGTPFAGTTGEPFFPVRCLEGNGSTAVAGATPASGEACRRGAIPDHIIIDDASVDADIEIVEVVDGVMEAPTGPLVVAWYKESGRLGEPNNIVVAGHLNWWNVPEGVFYHLAELEEGDRIEVIGDDGATYLYEVRWVRQESSLDPPPVDVIGPTDEPSLTLITCGGEWDPVNAEYTDRTIVRAAQVDVISGTIVAVPEGGDGADGPSWATHRTGIDSLVKRPGDRRQRPHVPRAQRRPLGSRAPSRRGART